MSLFELIDIKKQEVQLYLAKPNLQVIHKFKDVNNPKLTVKFDDLHELSFSIPYKIDVNHQLVDNPAISLVRERYAIKVVLGQLEEYFIINKIIKAANDVNELTINCFHLPYELRYKRYKSYSATSYNCLQVTNDCLDGTAWKVGFIDPSFNIKYRQFDLSSGNRLDFLNEISKTFDAVKTYDTKYRLVNFNKESTLSNYKGFNIKEGQYIDGISDEIDLDQIVTRLFVYGSDDLTVNDVTANGQSYIEDFSYFMYPFSMDVSGKVVQSSHFMSDELCESIIAHQKLLAKNEGVLSGFFSDISDIQEEITEIQNKIDSNNTELKIVDANIKIAKENNLSLTEYHEQRKVLVENIAIQNKALKSSNSAIDIIKKKINDLKEVLILENYLKEISADYLIEELMLYIHEDDWSDENIIDDTELYNAGLEELSKRNSPPVNISISLIDFLSVVEERHNWDKLNIGDLVNIIHPTLGVKIQTKIIEITYDFESESINLSISNSKRIVDAFEKIRTDIYNNNKSSQDYKNRKINWEKTSYNFNSRNDRISVIPANPTFNNNISDVTHIESDNGSVSLTVSWTHPTDKTKDEYNIDGFNVYLYASKTVENITLGSLGNDESIVAVSTDSRNCTIPSVPANQYYYIGIQAYRRVDNDISSNGILLSEIVTSAHSNCYPYRPSNTVNINGRVNGVMSTVGETPHDNPQINDKWTDTITNTQKTLTANGWEITNAGEATSLNGKTDADFAQLNSSGMIIGSITGSATTLNGKTENNFAQLDINGKISVDVIPNIKYFDMGSYTGDGTQLKEIILPFKPKLVKIYSTNNTDESLFIPSVNGGYKFNIDTNHLMLTSSAGNAPDSIFGKLTESGFIVAQDTSLFGNKAGNLYYWEAIKE